MSNITLSVTESLIEVEETGENSINLTVIESPIDMILSNNGLPGAKGEQGEKGDKGDPGLSGVLVLSATEDIPAFSVITSTGKNADSTNVFHKNIIAGITIAEILSGFTGTVVKSGQVVNENWNWTPGNILYLNGTSISITAPLVGFRVIIGQAISQTVIDVNISESIFY